MATTSKIKLNARLMKENDALRKENERLREVLQKVVEGHNGSHTYDCDGHGYDDDEMHAGGESECDCGMLDGGTESGPDAQADGGDCWRCADRAWRNVCVTPAERAPDSESCLHCAEHCVSDPPDAAGE